MKRYNAVSLANLKPFTGKDDPRRNKTGNKTADRAAWAINFNNALAEKADPDKLIKKLLDLAERGCEWAMKEVLDRLMGKSTQPISGSLGVDLRDITAKQIYEAEKQARAVNGK
jgi:hypothetical protein